MKILGVLLIVLGLVAAGGTTAALNSIRGDIAPFGLVIGYVIALLLWAGGGALLYFGG